MPVLTVLPVRRSPSCKSSPPGWSALIRYATPADSVALASLAERTFRDTFSNLNEAADMEAYIEQAFGPRQVEAEIGDPTHTFLLAFEKSEEAPTGYAKLRAGEPDPSVRGAAPAIEIERIYVGREALGKGVGAALMRACLDEARRRGYETVWLGVWESNEKAIAFYRRWEFEEVGSHEFVLGSDKQTDLIMERTVRSG